MSTIKKLSTTTVYFAEDKEQLEDKVAEIKEEYGSKVVRESIVKKSRKSIEYFLLEVTVEDASAKDITDEIAELYKEQ